MLIAFNERSERQVQLSTYFDQLFKSLTKQDWDTRKIDKAIKEIERCNEKIYNYKNNKKDLKKSLAILGDKDYYAKIIIECFGCAVLATALGMAFDPMVGAGAQFGGILAIIMPIIDDKGKYAPRLINDLEKENNKALNWLKKEKERIENGTAKKKKLGDIILGKQEGCSIFESVEFISEGIFGNLFNKSSKQQKYSEEELNQCTKKVKEIWSKHSSKWKAIIQKELNSSKYGKYYYLGMEEFIYEDYTYTAFLVSINYLNYDPNLREHFDDGNPIKPLEDFQKVIITKLKEYCSKNKLDFIQFSDDGGDWESTSIDATIQVSALIRMIQEQSSIFESVELI